MDRPAKLRKLEDLKRKVPALSASALAGVLQEVRESGLPDLVQRKHVREATVKTLEKRDAYGPIMKSICLAEGLIFNAVNLSSLLLAVRGVVDCCRALRGAAGWRGGAMGSCEVGVGCGALLRGAAACC